MNCTANKQLINRWVATVGGMAKATLLIMEALECSASKAEKIAGGRYPSGVSATEQKALALLWDVPRDQAFKPVSAGKRARAS